MIIEGSMKRFVLLVLFLLFAFGLFAQEDKVSDVNVENKDASVKARTYSEKEFQDEVIKEVSIKVEKIKKTSVAILVKEVLEKERKLKMKELDLLKNNEMIENNSKELQRKIKEFEDRQQKIIGCMDENDKNANNRVSQMVDIISSMKPAKAAEMLSVQDSGLAVQVLSGMDPAKVSKVFNLMDKEISARLQKQYMNMQK